MTTIDNLYDIKDFPLLYLGNRKGHTDYIDFIKWEEVTSPIMKGYDCFNRKFIVIKMIVDNVKIMQTFFQRYSANPKLWMGCGCSTTNLIDTSGSMDNNQLKLLIELLNNKRAFILKEHRPWRNHFINKWVYVYDDKQWNAALVIQKYWRLCRYNPNYKLCHTIQTKNLHDIYDDYNIIKGVAVLK